MAWRTALAPPAALDGSCGLAGLVALVAGAVGRCGGGAWQCLEAGRGKRTERDPVYRSWCDPGPPTTTSAKRHEIPGSYDPGGLSKRSPQSAIEKFLSSKPYLPLSVTPLLCLLQSNQTPWKDSSDILMALSFLILL